MGIVTESGSKTSHAVIVARSLKMPAVVGVRELIPRIAVDDKILVDGYEGIVVINPSEETLFRYGQIREKKHNFEQRLMKLVERPSVTLDGVEIPLRANIEKSDEVALVKQHAAAGVGLYRTEFQFLSSPRVPTEEDLYQSYAEVSRGIQDHPVVIRTLDLGGDKPMSGAPQLFPHEANPFLGFRAIRFCLAHLDIFKMQLRAILRASAHGPVELMFPMISGLEEMRRAKEVLEHCKEELRAEGHAFNPRLPVGSMIEVPGAAIIADLLAKECDFFSIGTNDLIQYVLAVDRINDRIAHLYEPTHPAVLRLIKKVVDEAHAAKIKVNVCGEMAGDPMLIPLLLGLGVDELSMTPPLLPAAKYLLRNIKLCDARELANSALARANGADTLKACVEFYRAHMQAE
jgi:phosphotransferase system enzyme I (PtsI)